MSSFGSCLKIEASVCAQVRPFQLIDKGHYLYCLIIEWRHNSSAHFTPQLYNSFPRLMGCLPGPHQTVKRIYQNIRDFIKEEIKEHRKNLDPSTTRDYVDCYLNKIQKVGLDWNASLVLILPLINYSLWSDFLHLLLSSNNILDIYRQIWSPTVLSTRRTWSCVSGICSWPELTQRPARYVGFSSSWQSTPRCKVNVLLTFSGEVVVGKGGTVGAVYITTKMQTILRLLLFSGYSRNYVNSKMWHALFRWGIRLQCLDYSPAPFLSLMRRKSPGWDRRGDWTVQTGYHGWLCQHAVHQRGHPRVTADGQCGTSQPAPCDRPRPPAGRIHHPQGPRLTVASLLCHKLLVTVLIRITRERLSSLIWPQRCSTRTSGRRHSPSTQDTFWTRRGSSGSVLPSSLSQLVRKKISPLKNLHKRKCLLDFLPSCLVGRRLCLGENLARMMLFLFFTSFMQEFTISFPAGVSPVMEYYHFGVTLAPHPFEICVVSR